MVRRLIVPAVFCAFIIGTIALLPPSRANSLNPLVQERAAAPTPTPAPVKVEKNSKNFTAEQIAESAIFIYGSRPVLQQIRRNGIERGRITRVTNDGKTEESTYERVFVRGDSLETDKIRLDQKLPTLEYTLIFGEGRLWGLINGAAFTPRQDAASAFMSQHHHSIEALLRYQENGATIKLFGKDKQKGLDLYVLDLTDKEQRSTRYYISVKTLHILWLEYSEGNIKFSKRFADYRYAQSTLVPFRTLLFEDDRQTQETRILTVTYGVKVDDALFKTPSA
ncbi:MAG TPA: hypothetical protein VJS64_07455 [Pyrinomonadaceae bacterium]|nr:hypothetical protein [Pyrinomonadaceae bacterium]